MEWRATVKLRTTAAKPRVIKKLMTQTPGLRERGVGERETPLE